MFGVIAFNRINRRTCLADGIEGQHTIADAYALRKSGILHHRWPSGGEIARGPAAEPARFHGDIDVFCRRNFSSRLRDEFLLALWGQFSAGAPAPHPPPPLP